MNRGVHVTSPLQKMHNKLLGLAGIKEQVIVSEPLVNAELKSTNSILVQAVLLSR